MTASSNGNFQTGRLAPWPQSRRLSRGEYEGARVIELVWPGSETVYTGRLAQCWPVNVPSLSATIEARRKGLG